MASVVDICNAALIALDGATINSIEDENESARACDAVYERIRDLVLRAHPWSCARKRAQIAAEEDAPEFGWSYAYELPADSLRLLDAFSSTDEADRLLPTEYTVEDGKILTDATSPVYVKYIRQVTDPNEMDPLLREAISARMATELCEAWDQSMSKKEALYTIYQAKLQEARSIDGQENPNPQIRSCDWLDARN